MKLTDMWKIKMIETLDMVYGNKISKEALSNELDRIIKSKEPFFPNMYFRNLYTNSNFTLPLNDIMDIINNEDLCISANNTLTYSYRKIKTPLPTILIRDKKQRSIHKNKEMEYEEIIEQQKKNDTFIPGSDIDMKFKYEGAKQLKIKAFMNSCFGVQGQTGSIIHSPDTAGAVTSQGRQLISEMLWTIERLLYGTIHFTNFSEYFEYLLTVKKNIPDKNDDNFLKYISYYPTTKDIIKTVSKQLKHVIAVDRDIDDIKASIFLFIKNLTDIERVYFYYNCNLMRFISNNIKVYKLFDDIINSPIDFLATGHLTPLEFKDNLDEICKLVDHFILPYMSTPNRVFKYINKKRRGIIVSDTDSIMINMNPYVSNLYKLHCIYHNKPIENEKHVTFHNENLGFKITNIISHLCIHATDIAGDIFCKQGNVPSELRKWIEMKNEFLFKRLVMYRTTKKNYVCHTILREGKYVDKIATTGIKLNSSIINPEIKDRIMNVIENDILKSENINPVKILREVKEIEKFIINKVKSGDLSYGKKSRFSGINAYKKTGWIQNNVGRSSVLWNMLYPENKIENGDYTYIFNTNLFTKSDAYQLSLSHPEIYDKLVKYVFENKDEPDLAKYGLKSIAIPLSESIKSIPDWIIPYIRYDDLTNKQLQSIITLLPSVGLPNSNLDSTKKTYSPLLSF